MYAFLQFTETVLIKNLFDLAYKFKTYASTCTNVIFRPVVLNLKILMIHCTFLYQLELACAVEVFGDDKFSF